MRKSAEPAVLTLDVRRLGSFVTRSFNCRPQAKSLTELALCVEFRIGPEKR
jgi:hypothetical protein